MYPSRVAPTDPVSLDPTLSQGLSTQSYGPAPQIDGLRILPLRAFRDDTGSFVELGRLDQVGRLLELPDFQVRQINHSLMLPDAIKAWHIHRLQDDVWFVPENSRILCAFRDLRAGSPTLGVTVRKVLGGGDPLLLRIPAGVAHGMANPFDAPAALIYLVDQHFNAESPDEHRLPWDHWGADIWEPERG